MTGGEIKIGLLWHSSSSGNLGVGALTIAHMALVREVAEGLGLRPRFTIIGMRDGVSTYLERSEADVFIVDRKSLLSPSGCWKVIGEQDCILDIGAGDSFADVYGPRRFAFMWLTKMIAVWTKTPIVLSPQTIGPFDKTPYKQLAAYAMRRCHSIVTRDRESQAVAQAMAPNARIILAADVAFALPYESQAHLRNGQRIRAGVNVSGLLFNEAASRDNFRMEVDYASLMRRYIDALIRRGDTEVHLITHVTTADPNDDDGRVADLLAKEFPHAVRAPDFPSPSAAKSYISGLDFLVSGRMHACIGAYSSGVPVAPVAYSRKFKGVFGLLDYHWMVPVRGLDTDAALAYLLERLDERPAISQAIETGMAAVRGYMTAYRSELADLFSKLKR